MTERWCRACQDATAADDSEFCATCDDALSHLFGLFYADLNLCGCGQPSAAYGLVRELLALAPYFVNGRRKRAEMLIGSPGAVHLVLSALSHAGLLMHASTIDGSWLTYRGAHYLELMQRYDWELVDGEVGFPHNGDDCPPDCPHLKSAEMGPQEQFQ